MKLKLLPLAIGAAIAMPSVAMAGPTVYGKMNVSVDHVDVEGSMSGSDADKQDKKDYQADNSADSWNVNSNASRLGFKGSEKITDDLSAFYKAEYQIAVDDGEDEFSKRNIYLGLKGGFGAVQAGYFDTPVKTAQKKVDLFNDWRGDIKSYIAGEERGANTIQYTTPSMGPIVAKVALLQRESDNGTDDLGNSDDNNKLGESYSSSVAFEQDNVYVALAFDDQVEADYNMADDSAGNVESDTVRLVGQFKFGPVQLGAMYQTSESTESDYDVGGGEATATDIEQDAFLISAAIKAGANGTVKVQLGESETEATFTTYETRENAKGVTVLEDKLGTVSVDSEASQFAVGYDHKLSKQTKLFAYYSVISFDDSALKGTGDYEDQDDISYSRDVTALGFGMEHKF